MTAGTLYLVGTPIGNLDDVTARARATLGSVELIAAEDTRRTGLLLSRLGIAHGRLLSLFDGNEAARVPEVVAALQAGTNVALVSDAGMPGVSDPGYRLVAACVEAGIPVDVVPGPSAVLAALVISGLPTDRFAFEGFLPRSGRARTERLREVAADPRTLVLFESARRALQTLRDLSAVAGQGRRAALVRELTKLHQEVLRGTLAEIAAEVEGRAELKGEVVLVLEGAGAAPAGTLEDAARIAAGLIDGGAKKREASRLASERTGVPARQIYQSLLPPS
jgi:16S rRNA (cytidine1402-2'-O)-methyltransferase